MTYCATRSSALERILRNENAPPIASLIPTSLDSSAGLCRGSRLLGRPAQVRVGNRVSVRVVCGEPEALVDPRFELLRDHVLEPVGLVMHVVDMDAQCLRQVQLEQ